ncbi:Non-canonical purine NTP pyrophosphatase [Posidoniimonas polymericola]|uniref:dITP/XTP pyrophosphatase n=1 Tax=Posidoniimonas polymericola TaxID=2528002 RepID=A0A5C5ZEK0_9BACT|nr:non-canonical purine NTP pyrophosphatase [Posidoniimonas polymericola]TWT85271.1 Non-canonical purine NTP pyrophosphatase [Posidoniimonas polymericola]
MPAAPLIIGTHNQKKGAELAGALAPHGVEVRTLAGVDGAIEVVEDGQTFADNARLKAVEQAKHLGQWLLADDSGIQVDALGGAPGVFSARFAGPECDDQANNRLLLEKLAGLPPQKRGAGYYCHVTLADPSGEIRGEATGVCRGVIVPKPRGSNGFGYDPLFEIRELHRTFGELGPAVKKALSHRSRAMRSILPAIVRELAR